MRNLLLVNMINQDMTLKDELDVLATKRNRDRERIVALLREIHWLRVEHRWHSHHIPIKCQRFANWSAAPFGVDHQLMSCHLNTSEFAGQFVLHFRGERLTYETSMPRRYLEGNAEQVMLDEADSELVSLRAEVEVLPLGERGEVVVKRLMARYPDRAADILTRSPDVGFRLKVSSLMARTLLQALDSGALHDQVQGENLRKLRRIFAIAKEVALGNLVVRTCYLLTKQPPGLRAGLAPLMLRNNINATGLGLPGPVAWDARLLLEALGDQLRDLFADQVFTTYMALIRGPSSPGVSIRQCHFNR